MLFNDVLLRTRRALMLLNILLRTRRALLLFNVLLRILQDISAVQCFVQKQKGINAQCFVQ